MTHGGADAVGAGVAAADYYHVFAGGVDELGGRRGGTNVSGTGCSGSRSCFRVCFLSGSQKKKEIP